VTRFGFPEASLYNKVHVGGHIEDDILNRLRFWSGIFHNTSMISAAFVRLIIATSAPFQPLVALLVTIVCRSSLLRLVSSILEWGTYY
jgi:hypothetical protein